MKLPYPATRVRHRVNTIDPRELDGLAKCVAIIAPPLQQIRYKYALGARGGIFMAISRLVICRQLLTFQLRHPTLGKASSKRHRARTELFE